MTRADGRPDATARPHGIRAVLRRPADAEAEVGAIIALGILLYLLLAGRTFDLLPSPARMFLVLSWVPVAFAFIVARSPFIVLAWSLFAGSLLRWADFHRGGSDVLPATAEAIATILRGENPYTHYFLQTSPQGSPVPYPPVAWILYLPGYLAADVFGVRVVELLLAIAAMGVFAVLAVRISWLVGLPVLATYAGAPNLINVVNDSSNDTGAGTVLLVAVVTFAWAASRGFSVGPLTIAGVAAAAALGTKQSTLPIIAMLAYYLWQEAGVPGLRRFLVPLAAVLGAVSAPFLVRDPVAYLRGLTSFAGAHEDVYGWNVWVFAEGMGWPVADVTTATILSVAVTLIATLVALLFRYRSTASALAAGIILTMILFLTSRWTAYSYFAMLAAPLLALPLIVRWEGRGWRSDAVFSAGDAAGRV